MSQRTNLFKLIKKSNMHIYYDLIATQALLNFLNKMSSNK